MSLRVMEIIKGTEHKWYKMMVTSEKWDWAGYFMITGMTTKTKLNE